MNSKQKTLFLSFFLILGFLSFSQTSHAATVTKTLYAWVKDAAGNISLPLSDTVDITLPDEPTNTYYVSYSEGLDTNNGTSSSTPWKTIAKVNSQTFTPGASILFKKGDTWTGETITVNSSGNSTSPITYSSYGTGAQPIISGFTTITGWTSEGGGIYSKVISPQSAPNMVLIDGVQYAMGRYPNTGWMYFESHVGTTSITDNQLTSSPNWTGAEVVLRKDAYSIRRYPITNHSTNTLALTISTAHVLTDNHGYFIQNSHSTLDQYGEWYYNSSTSTLSVYFGSTNPTTKTTQVPVVNHGITSNYKSYFTIENLTIQGSNLRLINLEYGSHVIVQNNNISYGGQTGVRIFGTDYVSVLNNIITNCNDIGIVTATNADYALIKGNNISTVLKFPGQGLSNEVSGFGILGFQTDYSIIENNIISDMGYIGIDFAGVNEIIRNNFIYDFTKIKSDGAGIYHGNQDEGSNMVVEGNIVLNSIGNSSGLPIGTPNGAGSGIYMDFQTTGGVTIRNNTVANCVGHGIFIHASKNMSITDNTVYNCDEQLMIHETPGLEVDIVTTDLAVSDNMFVSKQSNQQTLWVRLNTGHVFTQLGTFDNNYYARPISDATSIKHMITVWDAPETSLADWKTLSGKDANSHTSPVTITDPNDILFEYNATTSNKVVSLGSNTYVDITGATKTGSVTLLPYTSIILIKTN